MDMKAEVGYYRLQGLEASYKTQLRKKEVEYDRLNKRLEELIRRGNVYKDSQVGLRWVLSSSL